MIELVINAPHLQTLRQRFGALAISVAGWLLWCYFLFPLVTLGCWLLDHQQCSQWVNFAGGYLDLQHLLGIYLKAVLSLVQLWLLWVVYNLIKQRFSRRPTRGLAEPVTTEELCRTFGVDHDSLTRCQRSRYAVVHYDRQGHIIGLERRETPRLAAGLDAPKPASSTASHAHRTEALSQP